MSIGLKPSRHSAAALILLLVVLALGLFFRVAHLDRKLYWHDEVYTSIRALGYTGEAVTAALFTGERLDRDDLLQYQRLDPQRGWGHTLYALSTHPEHPPLYYLLMRGWVSLFGTSVSATRSLSVVLSLLTFPALYWLCQMLFNERVWPVAMALWAVSPVQVLYAQEARPYSLWVMLTLLSTAALLWAVPAPLAHKEESAKPQGARRRWVVYALAITAAFYTSLLSGAVWLCHGLCLLMLRQWDTLRRWLLASALAGVLFLPWIVVMSVNWGELQQNTEWTTNPSSLPLWKIWGLHYSSGFVDLGFPLDHSYTLLAPAIVLALLAWAMAALYRHTPRQTWLLVGLLLVVPFAVLAIPDVLFGGSRSRITRYVLPSLAFAQVAVSYLVTSCWHRSAKRMVRWGAQGLAVLLLTVGILSCAISLQAEMWWNKTVGAGNADAIAFLQQVDRPIVISQLSGIVLGEMMSIAHGVQPSAQFVLLPEGGVPMIPQDDRNRFLFHSGGLSDALAESGFTVEPVASARVLRRIRAAEAEP